MATATRPEGFGRGQTDTGHTSNGESPVWLEDREAGLIRYSYRRAAPATVTREDDFVAGVLHASRRRRPTYTVMLGPAESRI